jgi:hypothetical protein
MCLWRTYHPCTCTEQWFIKYSGSAGKVLGLGFSKMIALERLKKFRAVLDECSSVGRAARWVKVAARMCEKLCTEYHDEGN